MTDQTAQPTGNEEGEHGALAASRPIPIPDGGLGGAMPEWLQQTPSWKRAPDPRPVRSIPAPDTSEIDPARLVDVDDLPAWLQSVAARGGEPTDRGAVVEVVDVPALSSPGPGVGRPKPAVESPDAWSPVVAIPGATEAEPERPVERHEPVQLVPSPSAERRPWWLSDAAVSVLFTAIVLTMIYVILVASGVL